MLPDFPKVKNSIHKAQIRSLYAEIDKHAPVISQVKQTRQHEGDKSAIRDQDGKLRTSAFKTIGSRLEIAANLGSEEMKEQAKNKLQELALNLAQQSEKMMFSAVEEATSEVGNALDARGKPFHMSMLLDMLEKMQIDFDQNNNPIMPTLVLHPDMLQAIQTKIVEWENDPGLKRRKKEILSRKREEWRDRESNRKLVG
ncbi:MAG: hypothetical protein LAO23_00585 [Acidobacteriia bacterium]|nr:hypothetical protein [Terriglobia bacterium]